MDYAYDSLPWMCAQWQESRHFRLGQIYAHWPNLYDDPEAMYVGARAIRKEADENVEALIDRAQENTTSGEEQSR